MGTKKKKDEKTREMIKRVKTETGNGKNYLFKPIREKVNWQMPKREKVLYQNKEESPSKYSK